MIRLIQRKTPIPVPASLPGLEWTSLSLNRELETGARCVPDYRKPVVGLPCVSKSIKCANLHKPLLALPFKKICIESAATRMVCCNILGVP